MSIPFLSPVIRKEPPWWLLSSSRSAAVNTDGAVRLDRAATVKRTRTHEYAVLNYQIISTRIHSCSQHDLGFHFVLRSKALAVCRTSINRATGVVDEEEEVRSNLYARARSCRAWS